MNRLDCHGCGSAEIAILLDAGSHPVANKFRGSPDTVEDCFHLVMGQCRTCGLVQLTTPVPVEAIVPHVDWVTYNEPEGHLDAVTNDILALPGVNRTSVVGAITYKDDSTLQRLRRNGISETWRIDASVDLGTGSTAGLETIQNRLTVPEASRLSSKYVAADVLLVRHILEHAYDTRQFLAAIRQLVKPGGYVVFEVPDCTQVLDILDYTTLWEEHVLYFTPSTLRDLLSRHGFTIVRLDVHPYPYENSLVVIAKPGSHDSIAADVSVEAELARGRRFGSNFIQRRNRIQAFLAGHTAKGGRTAIFGAGHLSCMFINLMQVADHVAFVVDDHPAKRGLFMPGSGLAIRPSDSLRSEGINLCLSSLSPESEEKVVNKLTWFVDAGGRFASLFPSSRRALPLVS